MAKGGTIFLNTIYARWEPSREAALSELPQWRDVVLYHDQECTRQAGIIPAHFKSSIPKKKQKYITHNCAQYNLVWLPPAPSTHYDICANDPDFPKIIQVQSVEGMTFDEAKRELLKKIRNEISHWRAIIFEVKKSTPKDAAELAGDMPRSQLEEFEND